MSSDPGDVPPVAGPQGSDPASPSNEIVDRLAALLSVDVDAVATPRRRRRIVIHGEDVRPDPGPDRDDAVTSAATLDASTDALVAELAASLGDRAASQAVRQPVETEFDPMAAFSDVADEPTGAVDVVVGQGTATDWFEFVDNAPDHPDQDPSLHDPAAGDPTDRDGARHGWAPTDDEITAPDDEGVGPSRWRRRLAGAVLVVLVLAGAGLAYVGSRVLRDSTGGDVVAPVADPGQAGFEAIVEPTPTFALLTEVDGSLDAVTVLAVSGDAGGGVVMVPDRTVADLPVLGRNPIEFAYDLGDPASGAQAVGVALNAGMSEFAVVDDDRWADLVAPVAPITIDNPNEITVDGAVRFPVGTIELAASDVGPYLASRIEGETDLARLFRHQVFWEAWLGEIAAAGTPEAVPGELDRGIGRFVRTIAAGQAEITTLPVEPLDPGAFGDEAAFAPQRSEVDVLVAALVTFPSSPIPGARPRVRILNGTDDTTEATTVAATLPPLGVSVTLIGNAATATQTVTTIEYTSPEFRAAAESIADELGVGTASMATQPGDSVDITVTLGADYD